MWGTLHPVRLPTLARLGRRLYLAGGDEWHQRKGLSVLADLQDRDRSAQRVRQGMGDDRNDAFALLNDHVKNSGPGRRDQIGLDPLEMIGGISGLPNVVPEFRNRVNGRKIIGSA